MDLGKAKIFDRCVRGADWWADVIAVSDLEDGRIAIDAVRGEQVRAEIALRLNAHQGLVEALKDAVPYIAGSYECAFPDEPENERVLQQAKAALAMLEGK
jgi:hypothetical protein